MGNSDVKLFKNTPFIPETSSVKVKETETKNQTNNLSEELSGLDKTTENPIQNMETSKINDENNKSKNGKFDLLECLKNFGKGLISPLKAIIEHPVISIGAILGTVVLCNIIPVAGIALATGFAAWSAFEIGKGTYDVINNYKNGKFDESEKSFENIGQGTVGLALSLIGLKQGAGVAQEAKIMNRLNLTKLTIIQREKITNSVNASTQFSALKEILSLFTTKSGIKAVLNEVRPTMIKSRWSDHHSWQDFFRKSKEYAKRKSMSDDEIFEKFQAEFNEIMDKMNISKEQRPRLALDTTIDSSAFYQRHGNIIKFNPDAYRKGNIDIESVIMHEATHFKEALLRAGIPQERVDTLIKEVLIKKIIDGENPKIILNINDMIEPPKLSPSLKQDFVEFAQKYLYKDDPFIDKTELQILLKKHPEFIQYYKNEEEALHILEQYATSHAYRFSLLRDNDIKYHSRYSLLIGDDTYAPLKLRVSELRGEKLAEAEKSLKTYIDCIEGNMFNTKEFDIGNKQYLFCSEEVLAEKTGEEYLIDKLINELNNLKKTGELTKEKEEYIINTIDKATIVIRYRLKGQDFFEKYRQMMNNPNNTTLQAEVKKLEKELKSMELIMLPSVNRISKYQRILLPLALTGEAHN